MTITCTTIDWFFRYGINWERWAGNCTYESMHWTVTYSINGLLFRMKLFLSYLDVVHPFGVVVF
jgi:hypothetical protein